VDICSDQRLRSIKFRRSANAAGGHGLEFGRGWQNGWLYLEDSRHIGRIAGNTAALKTL
jgi:hypothetical protein